MKYIFWDFNGTVLDDVELCHEILSEMLKEEDRPAVTLEDYLHIFTFPVRAYYEIVYDLDKTPFDVLAHRFIDRYQPRSLSCKLHDGVIDTILQCERLGYTNVLLSASEVKNLASQLEHFKIGHLFKHILGTQNIYATSKVQVAQAFIKEHNINPNDILMIGDTLHDAEVAESLGCDIILFTKGHQHPSRLTKYKNIHHISEILDKI